MDKKIKILLFVIAGLALAGGTIWVIRRKRQVAAPEMVDETTEEVVMEGGTRATSPPVVEGLKLKLNPRVIAALKAKHQSGHSLTDDQKRIFEAQELLGQEESNRLHCENARRGGNQMAINMYCKSGFSGRAH